MVSFEREVFSSLVEFTKTRKYPLMIFFKPWPLMFAQVRLDSCNSHHSILFWIVIFCTPKKPLTDYMHRFCRILQWFQAFQNSFGVYFKKINALRKLKLLTVLGHSEHIPQLTSISVLDPPVSENVFASSKRLTMFSLDGLSNIL